MWRCWGKGGTVTLGVRDQHNGNDVGAHGTVTLGPLRKRVNYFISMIRVKARVERVSAVPLRSA